MLGLVIVLLTVACTSAFTPCVQRSFPDFRADDNDCRTFHICSFGRLVTLRCPLGGVFDDRSLSCVPTHSFLDRCSRRLTSHSPCPRGSKDRVPHPSHCAQYYDCAATRSAPARRGWGDRQRECPYPFVFSSRDGKCVALQHGVCEGRQEPLDPCDYKANQCEGHSDCVPCHIRFPSCRGRKDGANPWAGRLGSPYYVTCHQERVLSTGMCKQDGAVTIFDEELLKCVKKEGQEPKLPEGVPETQQNVPHPFPIHGFIPHRTHPQRPGYLGNQAMMASSQEHKPQVPEQIHTPEQNQEQSVPKQYQQNQDQQQQQDQQKVIQVPYLRV